MEKRLRYLLGTMWFITLFASLNINMMNLGIPQIAQAFSLDSAEASWITSGFVLFTGLAAITFGKLSDIFPTRHLMTVGIGFLFIGSIIGILSQHFWVAIFARIVQGAGAGSFFAVSMVMTTKFYPPERRGMIIGILMSSITFGAGFGPLVGGYLTQLFNWRVLFALSLLSIVALPFLWRLTPEEAKGQGRMDFAGAFFTLLSVLFLLLSIQISGWLLLLSVVFILLMVWHSRRKKEPFFRVGIFKNIPYSMTALMVFILNLCHIAALFVLPLMLINANGLSEGWAGLIIFPGAALSAFFGGPIGRLTDRLGSLKVIPWATVAMSIPLLLISTFAGQSVIWIMLAVLIEYIAYSINQVSIFGLTSHVLAPHEAGAGMGMVNLFLYIGMAAGTAMFGRFLTLDMGKWNPLNDSTYISYSNAFLVLGLLTLTTMIVAFITKKVSQAQEV